MRFSTDYCKIAPYRLRAIDNHERVMVAKGWTKHWHPFWVVDVWRHAKGWVRVKGESFQRSPNSVAVYAPRVIYAQKGEVGGFASTAWVQLEAESEEEPHLLKELVGEKGCLVLEDPAGLVRKIISEIFEAGVCRTSGTPYRLSGYLQQLIGTLLEINVIVESGRVQASKYDQNWVHPWKRIAIIELEKALPDSLHLHQLAAALNVSASTLTHHYRQNCGETFKQTIQHWRLEKAIVLLQQRELSLKEIASQLGMAHQSYLTSFLKSQTGHSPSALRTMILEGNKAVANVAAVLKRQARIYSAHP